MIDNIKELLPIGSVIRLRGARKCLMIYGVMQTEKQNNKEYDYIGVIWPEGNLGAKTHVLFNHADVEEVVFTGLHNDQRQDFIERLYQHYESKK